MEQQEAGIVPFPKAENPKDQDQISNPPLSWLLTCSLKGGCFFLSKLLNLQTFKHEDGKQLKVFLTQESAVTDFFVCLNLSQI